MRLPSKHEAFINDKTQWISDKFFTQQRLAGTNPMSIKRVTIHGESKTVGRITINTFQYLFRFKYVIKINK